MAADMFDWASTGLIAYVIGAVSWTSLTLLVITSWRGRLQGGILLAAALLTALWCWIEAVFAASGSGVMLAYSLLGESAAMSAWLIFLVRLWGVGEERRNPHALSYHLIIAAVVAATLTVVGADLLVLYRSDVIESASLLHLVSTPLIAISGLALLGDAHRRGSESGRWASGHLFAGLASLFLYQLFLFLNGFVFSSVSGPLWEMRGLLLAGLAPLVAVSVARNTEWSVELFVSRAMVMVAIALLGSAAYMVVVTALGHYIRMLGGDWGPPAQLAFLVISLVALLTVLTSRQVRASARVFVDKHFFNFRYDYRSEWLRLIETMSRPGLEDARVRSIRALAELLDSPGGALWLRDSKGLLVCQAHWMGPVRQPASVSLDDEFASYLRESEWIIDLEEFAREPDRYPGLSLPEWVTAYDDVWLVVPLLLEEELMGFVLLKRSAIRRHLNWEDHDLLKTIGRQLSGYLALTEATEELIEARQFEGFNRLTAYLVHDLKNVSAQLGLVVSNARKHSGNRQFVDDAIRTVENAASKMNRMLDSLRQGVEHAEQRPRLVDLRPLLSEVISEHRTMRPIPELEAGAGSVLVSIDPDRLKTIVGNLIQNAQEATTEEGTVCIRLGHADRFAVIEISDSGSGMDEGFVRERLFRPFDTTKGSAGMGIGAYESREFVYGAGGAIEVSSQPGKGTTFTLRIPKLDEAGSEETAREKADA